MSTTDEQAPQEGQKKTDTATSGAAAKVVKRRFSRTDIPRTFRVGIQFHKLLPDHEPFVFTFRYQLSSEARKKREAWLGMDAEQRDAAARQQTIEELADLLVADPTGFEDWPTGGATPGDNLRQYVAETTDPNDLEFVYNILDAASTQYWNYVLPREFLTQV